MSWYPLLCAGTEKCVTCLCPMLKMCTMLRLCSSTCDSETYSWHRAQNKSSGGADDEEEDEKEEDEEEDDDEAGDGEVDEEDAAEEEGDEDEEDEFEEDEDKDEGSEDGNEDVGAGILRAYGSAASGMLPSPPSAVVLETVSSLTVFVTFEAD